LIFHIGAQRTLAIRKEKEKEKKKPSIFNFNLITQSTVPNGENLGQD
jgi:hypothetical protein